MKNWLFFKSPVKIDMGMKKSPKFQKLPFKLREVCGVEMNYWE